ncbi:MAG: hypothetical protein IPG23_26270 [Burkholderiales bacterium]|nr:hypothetical protein [Burkholderiales bacterium]
MTAYRDIYCDLPSRVHEVWQLSKAKTDSSQRDLSVTAMLMAAATGFAMPWESLKDVGSGNRNDWNAHPSFAKGDQAHYQSVLKSCDKFLSQKISDNPSLQSVSFRHCSDQSDICDVAEYGNRGKKLELNNHTVRCAVRVLRNALAHNNIVAFGLNSDQIDKLGFFSENRVGSGCVSTVDGYLVVTFTTSAFQDFLDAWFLILKPEKNETR